MKTVVILSVFILLSCPLSLFGQNTNLTLKVTNEKLSDVLDLIEKQAGYQFFYNNKLIDDTKTITLDVSNESIQSVLKKVFDKTSVTYQINEKDIVLSAGEEAKTTQVQGVVTGKVTDASSGKGMPFVSVAVVGTTVGINTDDNGNYSITANNNATLQFSFVGFATAEHLVGNRTNIDIALEPEASQLDAVVVTALGIKRAEKALGYVTQTVDGDKLTKVKGTNVATSLTGQVAGLQILNSTEFMEEPTISMRGTSTTDKSRSPLLVVDGVPYENMKLTDLSSDDIQNMDVLKGPAAAALYGERGGNGAIMITTKRGGQKGFSVSINTSNMFNAGFLALPEVQTSYSAGYNGKYNAEEYVWGDKMDIGRMYPQWDPISKTEVNKELRSVGKNNFKNFLEFSYISNTNVSFSQQGENGSVRASINYLRNKGQYPNSQGQQFNYNVSGEMKLGDKVKVDASVGFTKRTAPNDAGTGYNNQGYIYNILIWTGTEYDLREYKDNYWIIPDEQQNWHYKSWYDNPYLAAHEKLNTIDKNKLNGQFTLNYEITKWAKMLVRSGYDFYSDNAIRRTPRSINSNRFWGGSTSSKGGYYRNDENNGYSSNNDLIFMTENKVGKLKIEGLLGGTIFYARNKEFYAASKGGLVIPGFYSITNAVETTGYQKDEELMRNSLYAKASFDYDGKIFLDLTGRNDWSSTLPNGDRSYFYPSASLSVIPSQFIKLPEWFSFWKVRGSWVIMKTSLKPYQTNADYTTNTNVWDGMSTANYPTTIRGSVKAPTERTIELGTAMNFLQNRIRFDFTYFNRLEYNNSTERDVSHLSGVKKKLFNSQEEYITSGFEIMLSAKAIDNPDFKWNIATNWSTARQYYARLDPQYSSDDLWTKKGNRKDVYTSRELMRAPDGQLIHNSSGLPIRSSYYSKIGYTDPDWNWGLTNTFNYKRFTLNISIDGRIGGRTSSATERYMWDSGVHPDSDNQWRYQEVVEGLKNYNGGGVQVVSGEAKYNGYGQITSDTRVFAPNTQGASYQGYVRQWSTGPQFIFDETFLKLRELSISYDIPETFVKKLGMTSASISAIGQNLFLWAKDFKYTDPDRAKDDLSSPSMRYVGFNLKLNF